MKLFKPYILLVFIIGIVNGYPRLTVDPAAPAPASVPYPTKAPVCYCHDSGDVSYTIIDGSGNQLIEISELSRYIVDKNYQDTIMLSPHYGCDCVDKCKGDVTIPKDLKTIRQYAFFKCKLNSVTFEEPSSVSSIGVMAFAYTGLTNIILPYSVTKVGYNAFYGLNYEYTLSPQAEFFVNYNVKTMSSLTYNCAKLKYSPSWGVSKSILNCPSCTCSDGDINLVNSQYQCSCIKKCDGILTVPNIDNIEDYAFMNCSNIDNINFESPNTITKIGSAAFVNSNLTNKNITIPSSVKTIGDYAFKNSGLEKIIFSPDSSLETIGDFAFHSCNIPLITIPSSVKTIGDSAFANSRLEKITFSPNSSLETIGDFAFSSCWNLTDITIPSSVKTIGNSAFAYYDKEKGYSSFDQITFSSNSSLETIGGFAFYSCIMPLITIPSSVKTIGSSAFMNSLLTRITFSSNYSLQNIEDFAFYSCNLLTDITIPSSVKTIGSSAFQSSGLEKIIFSSDSTLETIGSNAFGYCISLTDITIPSSVTSIGDFAFINSGLTQITFSPDSSLETIGSNAFDYCTLLTDMTIPSSVKSIGDSAFFNSGLTQITFSPDSSLETIGSYAFSSCIMLTSITIPSSVKTIGYGAFADSGLTQVTFSPNSSLETIGSNAFSSCIMLTNITSPSSVKTIGDSAFYEFTKVNLESCENIQNKQYIGGTITCLNETEQ